MSENQGIEPGASVPAGPPPPGAQPRRFVRLALVFEFGLGLIAMATATLLRMPVRALWVLPEARLSPPLAVAGGLLAALPLFGGLLLLDRYPPAFLRDFRDQVETRTRIRLPDFPNDSGFAAGALAGLILFDEKWRGRWTPFERAWFLGSNPQAPNRNSRRAARLRKAFSDACQRVGLAVAPPWLNLPHLLALLLIAAAVAGLTGMLIYALAGHH